MTVSRDTSFGATAVKLGFVSEQQVAESLDIQKKMSAMGIDETIGEILQKKGYLTGQHHRAVLKAIGVSVSPIPGYRLVARLGAGGMGTVYKATQTSMHRTVAIKILSEQFSRDPSYVARFFQEAQAAAKLNHKNIMGSYDAGEAHGTCYFVMEFVDGRTTREMHEATGNFSEAMLIDVARQVAEALDYVHRHKMVHRDVKPENVMMASDGVAKLCDFGLAKSQTNDSQSLTQAGYVVGTPYYMSPEQVTGVKDLDIRADLYSLGATLYFLASGRFVFEGKTAAETMSLHLTAPTPDPRKTVPGLSEGFAIVLHKLLEKDRSERYQSPGELIEDLDKLHAGAAPVHARRQPTHGHLKRPHHVRPRTTPTGLIAAGAVLVVALVALGLAFRGGSEPPAPVPKPPETAAKGPTPPVKPSTDPARESEAARLHTQATEAVAAERWGDAKTVLEKLRADFPDTDFVRTHAAAVGEKIGLCETRIAAAVLAIVQRYQQAQRLMQDENWDEARAALELIRKEGRYTPDVTAEQVGRDADLCAGELLAEESVEAIVSNVNAGRWELVAEGAVAFKRDHFRTSTGRKELAAIDGFDRTAKKELEAQKTIASARSASIAEKWDDVALIMTRITQEFAATKAYLQNRELIDRLSNEVVNARRREMESEAETSWKALGRKVDELLGQQKFEDAEALVSGWEMQYKMTAAYQKTLSAEADRLHKAITKARDRSREDATTALVKQAREEHAARRWEGCYKALESIAREYATTSAAKSNAAIIKKMRDDCEREGGLGAHILWREDFEAKPETWRPGTNTETAPTMTLVPEPHDGTTGGRFWFPSTRQRGDYSMIWSDVRLDPRAESFTFWVRAAKKGAVVQLRPMLAEFGNGSPNEEFTVDLPNIKDQWTRVALKVADFKLQWSDNGNKTLDRDRVTGFGFMQPDRGTELEFYVDSLRMEAAKK